MKLGLHYWSVCAVVMEKRNERVFPVIWCCCGHGKAHPYTNVPEWQFWDALKLGFRPYYYPNDLKRKDAVYWPTK